MDGDEISCRSDNPFRRPEWQWNRAIYLIESGEPAGSDIDDSWVTRATTYLAVASGAQQPDRRPRKPNDPVVAAAATCWDQNSETRWRLEALVLADQPVDTIAEQCGLPIDVVEAYEALFFDVRARLSARDWVANNVLGAMLPASIRRDAPASLWRIAGFQGGPHILATVIAVTMNQPMPAPPPERLPDGYADVDDYENHIRRKCQIWIAMLTAETNNEWAQIGRDTKALAQQYSHVAGGKELLARLEVSCDMLALLDAKPRRSSVRKSVRKSRRVKPIIQD